MPTPLRIRHTTTYSYLRPVRFAPHRLMLRPRESRDLRLIASEVTTVPAAMLATAPAAVARFQKNAAKITGVSAAE